MEKILESQELTLIELGTEAAALKLRIKELMKGVEKETNLVIRDYTKLNLKKTRTLLKNLSYEELIDSDNILLAMAQDRSSQIEAIKGCRILDKTKLNDKEVGSLIKEYNNLGTILDLKKEDIEGFLGKEEAIVLTKDIERIKNQ